ncbi:hypothetical protein O7623_07690 [Solwaraspora sp. WMMD791]|uniref:hypothetical protein n=1 Tax=Solwaraspora sp. WMMD791 TaxID=3016086 RepID=UPI00249A5260|nr:hypothetical protein [Solwaraspora sp. WMMD791]WFE29054.1 hypothetical protein O7623_07690 [Solwaraspora sp. WMMD791]
MAFPAVRLTGCFPEAHGFVLLDPARLDQHLGADSAGRDLLELFTTTDAARSPRGQAPPSGARLEDDLRAGTTL